MYTHTPTSEREGWVTDGLGSAALYVDMPFVRLKINICSGAAQSPQNKSTEEQDGESSDVNMMAVFSCGRLPAAALWSSMSSSYATAISVLTSDGSLRPPTRPQTSPDMTRRTTAFCPSGNSGRKPPVAQTRFHESFDEQQENPADYGIGEQHLHQDLIMETLYQYSHFNTVPTLNLHSVNGKTWLTKHTLGASWIR